MARNDDRNRIAGHAIADSPSCLWSADLDCEFAVAQRLRGDFERALTSCRRALALRSDYSSGWHNLGLTLIDLNRPSEAIDALLKGSVCTPSIVDLHRNGRLFPPNYLHMHE